MPFDPSQALQRIEKFWSLNAEFGMEHNAYRVYLNEIVSGVEPGERIVDKGAGFLKDGDRVRVIVGVPEAGAGA